MTTKIPLNNEQRAAISDAYDKYCEIMQQEFSQAEYCVAMYMYGLALASREVPADEVALKLCDDIDDLLNKPTSADGVVKDYLTYGTGIMKGDKHISHEEMFNHEKTEEK